jgi:hypothetical protein
MLNDQDKKEILLQVFHKAVSDHDQAPRNRRTWIHGYATGLLIALFRCGFIDKAQYDGLNKDLGPAP